MNHKKQYLFAPPHNIKNPKTRTVKNQHAPDKATIKITKIDYANPEAIPTVYTEYKLLYSKPIKIKFIIWLEFWYFTNVLWTV